MSNDFNIKSLQDFEQPVTLPYKHKIPSELVAGTLLAVFDAPTQQIIIKYL